jgi:hypothetical protein
MEPTTSAVVRIRARTIIAGNNLVKLDRGQLDIPFLLMDLRPDVKEAVTVLGNIGNGAIHVSGAVLGTPWQALNVLNASP